MPLKTSSTGSWPPTSNPDNPDESIRYLPPSEQKRIVEESTKRAIDDQIELGIDILVDGQVRDDLISLFALKLPGYSGHTAPYPVVGRIQPSEEPITVQDYLLAKDFAGDRPLKAHLTGPITMASVAHVDSESQYASSNDSKLILDLARALGQEAQYLVNAGAKIVQIDEPALAGGVDLELAFKVMQQIIEIGEIPFPALHICANVTKILNDVLTRSPVKMVSIEGAWLNHNALRHIDHDYLTRCGKQIGLGCIQVSKYTVEKLTKVQSFLDRMVFRLGEENIWAVMPNCGLRYVPHDVARKKLEIMVQAARFM